MPDPPVHYQLLESTQIRVHRVDDVIQPSHPLSSPSPPAPIPSQHQGLFHESALRIRWPKYWSFSFSMSANFRSEIGIAGECSFSYDLQAEVVKCEV